MPFLLGLVLILAALPLGYFFFLRDPPPTPVPVEPVAPQPAPVVEAPEPAKPVRLEITQVSGTVEVRAKDGSWVPVDKGATLGAADAVRTLNGSYAVIIGSESVEINMEPGTEVTVEELTTSVSRLLLGTGMATTKVLTGKGHTIEFKAANSDALARASEPGTFTMSNDGAGTVAVGARSGKVEFIGSGKVVIVRAGQQSVVRPGGDGPSAPMPVPTSLLRKVQWPSRQQNKKEIVVKGEAEPGSRLELAGKAFSPGQDGTFTVTVPLKEGDNEVKVRAVSVSGVQQEEQRKFSVDTRPPVTFIPSPFENSGGQ
ncbi:MAG TPA: hypothetical protein VF815_21025 [Myxococcaceae bacterium]